MLKFSSLPDVAVCNSLNLNVPLLPLQPGLAWQGPAAPGLLVTDLSDAFLALLCHSSAQNREWDHRHMGSAERAQGSAVCTKWGFYFLDNKGDGI